MITLSDFENYALRKQFAIFCLYMFSICMVSETLILIVLDFHDEDYELCTLSYTPPVQYVLALPIMDLLPLRTISILLKKMSLVKI